MWHGAAGITISSRGFCGGSCGVLGPEPLNWGVSLHEATTDGPSWSGFGSPTAPRTLSKNLIRLFGKNKVRRAS